MARPYRAHNKRIIQRRVGGQFRETHLDDVGMGICKKCSLLFFPDYDNLSERPIDPRKLNQLKEYCPDCLKEYYPDPPTRKDTPK